MHTRAGRKMLVFRAARMWRSGPLCEPDSDANLRAEFRHIPEQQNTGGCPPLCYKMHMRAEGRCCPTGDPHAAQRLALRALNAHACGRKMLPHRRPARRAAARSASLECTPRSGSLCEFRMHTRAEGRCCLTGDPYVAQRLALRALT